MYANGRLVIFLIGVFALSQATALGAPPVNALNNAGFEAVAGGEVSSWSTPEYWSGSVSPAAEPDAARSGKRSARLTAAFNCAAEAWSFGDRIAISGPRQDGVFHHMDSAGRKSIAVNARGVAVAWEDKDGKGYLAYTDPAALKARYGITGKDALFAKMTGALNKFTDMATKKGALPKR